MAPQHRGDTLGEDEGVSVSNRSGVRQLDLVAAARAATARVIRERQQLQVDGDVVKPPLMKRLRDRLRRSLLRNN